jgi:pyroglutamyl-peptidase
MSHILLTGFTPFDGREFNASWIAARALIATHRSENVLHGLCIPVCWGQPRLALAKALAQWQPRCVIAMGEGATGFFKIESLAHNLRASRKDNNDQFPDHPLIDPQGPDTRPASAPCSTLCSRLSQAGYPVQLSSDAGAYLCEETLYTLETFKEQHPSLKTVIFVHLPPFGSDLILRGESRQCDEALLVEFSQQLLASMSAQNLL